MRNNATQCRKNSITPEQNRRNNKKYAKKSAMMIEKYPEGRKFIKKWETEKKKNKKIVM